MAWSFAEWDRRQLPVGRHGLVVWVTWTLLTVAGEVAGLAFVAGTGWGVSMGFGKPAGILLAFTVAAMILAGAVEGAALGLAQSLVLCRELPSLTHRAWIRATAMGAAAAWAVGIVASMLAHGARGTEPAAGPAATMVVALLGALTLGALLGAAQWLELRRHVRGAARWIPVNAIAWVLGLPIAVAGGSSVGPEGSLAGAAVIGALTGTATGLIVGAITGLALLPLLQQPLDRVPR
jgi:hypothetical protein